MGIMGSPPCMGIPLSVVGIFHISSQVLIYQYNIFSIEGPMKGYYFLERGDVSLWGLPIHYPWDVRVPFCDTPLITTLSLSPAGVAVALRRLEHRRGTPTGALGRCLGAGADVFRRDAHSSGCTITSDVRRRYELGHSSCPNPEVGTLRKHTDILKSYIFSSRNIT